MCFLLLFLLPLCFHFRSLIYFFFLLVHFPLQNQKQIRKIDISAIYRDLWPCWLRLLNSTLQVVIKKKYIYSFICYFFFFIFWKYLYINRFNLFRLAAIFRIENSSWFHQIYIKCVTPYLSNCLFVGLANHTDEQICCH